MRIKVCMQGYAYLMEIYFELGVPANKQSPTVAVKYISPHLGRHYFQARHVLPGQHMLLVTHLSII